MLIDDPNSASGKRAVIDTLEWPPSALAVIDRLRAAIEEIRVIVHTPSHSQRPMDHFPKDFDRIRAIIKSVQ